MGVNTLTRGILAIFLGGIVYFGMMPTINDLINDEQLWTNVIDSKALALREYAFFLYLIAGLIYFFVIVVWMLNASSSKGGFTAYG